MYTHTHINIYTRALAYALARTHIDEHITYTYIYT